MSNSKIKINIDSLKTRREWKRHKVKDGHNVFRILPPFGEESGGYASHKWQIIWGLKNPEDGRMRPYASSMTSEKRCPIVEFVNELKQKVEKMKTNMQADGTAEEVIKETLAPAMKLISDLSPKTIYVYNAVDKSGEVGLLELKTTAHRKMKAEMMQYIQDYNQDPTSLNSEEDDSGVWFDVIRSGMGRDTEYDVKKCQIKTKNAAGRITFEDDRSPLPESVVGNFENLAYNLHSIYQIKSYDELSDILEANMPEIAEMCPEVFDRPSAPVVKPAAKPAVKPAVKATQTKVALNLQEDDEEETPWEAEAPKKAANKPVTTSLSEDEEFQRLANEFL